MKSNPSRATTLCALVSTHKIQTLASGTLPSFRNASSILLQSFFNPSSILLRSFFNRLKLLTLGPIDTIHAFPPPWCDSGSSNSSCKIFLNILEDREPRDASQNYHWIHYKLYLPQAHILETNIYRERRYVSIMHCDIPSLQLCLIISAPSVYKCVQVVDVVGVWYGDGSGMRPLKPLGIYGALQYYCSTHGINSRVKYIIYEGVIDWSILRVQGCVGALLGDEKHWTPNWRRWMYPRFALILSPSPRHTLNYQ